MRLLFAVIVFSLTAPAHTKTLITWKRLLHFDHIEQKSRISNPDFFISPKGHINAKAELEASLLKIRSESHTTPLEERFSCRFPARKKFLESYYKEFIQDCPPLEEEVKAKTPESLVFVFTAQFLGNPASTMGHSFLRFDLPKKEKLLSLAFSYFAKTNPKDNSLMYAIRGLFGGYTGIYELDQFYPKSELYGSRENRDLWEYELLLTNEQKTFLLMHAIELTRYSARPYNFLDRNCSYLILEFLDVAEESFDLAGDSDGFFVAPIETLRVLKKAKLLGTMSLRPSLRRKTEESYSHLTKDEKVLVKRILENKLMPETQSTKVLSTATEILTLRNLSHEKSDTEKIVFDRSSYALAKRLPEHDSDEIIKEKISDPLSGHDLLQFQSGFASTKDTSSLQLGFRPAAHALEDSPKGHLPNNQLIFLETTFRFENKNNKLMPRLRKLTFVDIKSFPNFSPVNNQNAWELKIGVIPTIGSQCGDCRALRGLGSWGLSQNITKDSLGYILGGGVFDAFNIGSFPQVGLGPKVSSGILASLSDNFFLRIEGRIEYFIFGPYEHERIYTTESTMTWHLSRNQSLTLAFIEARNGENNQFSNRDYSLRLSQSF